MILRVRTANLPDEGPAHDTPWSDDRFLAMKWRIDVRKVITQFVVVLCAVTTVCGQEASSTLQRTNTPATNCYHRRVPASRFIMK